MIKFKNVGAFKNVRNVGNVPTTVELTNGMLVTLDRATGEIAFPTDATANVWIVMNEREPIEYKGTNDDIVIEAGDYPRLFDASSAGGEIIQMNDVSLDTDYSEIAVGDVLVANASGKFEKSADATGYAVSFNVIAKTGFAGNGLEIEVVA